MMIHQNNMIMKSVCHLYCKEFYQQADKEPGKGTSRAKQELGVIHDGLVSWNTYFNPRYKPHDWYTYFLQYKADFAS